PQLTPTMSPHFPSLLPTMANKLHMADRLPMMVDQPSSPGLSVARPSRLAFASAFVLPLAVLAFAGCSGSGGGGTGSVTPGATVQPELSRVEYGRLVDVYGLRVTPQGAEIDIFQRDVVIGGNIQDQRPTESNLSDSEITYDFLAADPDTLQPR